MGLTLFHGMFLDVFHIQTECGKYMRMFRGILSVLFMDLSNGMLGRFLVNKMRLRLMLRGIQLAKFNNEK